MCATITCGRVLWRAWPQPRSTEHACRAYDVSDGLLDSTARPCRGGGGARLRVIVVAGAQSHSDQSQIAVAELPKYYYESYDPFLSLAAAAAVTKTIKLATGICLVVERDPIHTAKEVSTVDRLSSGRFIFGVGGGWNEEVMANHGTAFATRF